jgi:ribose transport system permease protein
MKVLRRDEELYSEVSERLTGGFERRNPERFKITSVGELEVAMGADQKKVELQNTEPKRPNRRRRMYGRSELSLVLAIMVLGGIIEFYQHSFLGGFNVLNLLLAVSAVAIAAIGEGLVMMMGEIDLSLGSMVGLGAVMEAWAATHGINGGVSVLIGVAAGFAGGLLNALATVYGGVNSFIVTLGTLSLFEGLTLLISNGLPIMVPAGIGGLSDSTKIGFVPMPLIIVGLCAVVAAGILTHTVFGRQVLAIGGNKEACRLLGIPVARRKVAVFVLAGGFAAFAGIVQAASLSAAEGGSGQADLLPIIAAVVIGGVSLYGGRGTITGILLGALLLGEIQNGYVALHLSSFLQEATFGAVIVAAGLADQARSGRFKGSMDFVVHRLRPPS